MDNGTESYDRYLDGDDGGLAEIIRDYKDGLILYLNGFTQNIHIAEELMEETFVKLAIKKPRFLHKSSFKTWLYAMGRNLALDYLRKNRVIFEPDTKLSEEQEDFEISYLREERRIIIHKAMKSLKPEYCQVLYLIFFEGFDNGQAARVMKKSKRQIENLIYRAKISLKSELKREGFVYEEL